MSIFVTAFNGTNVGNTIVDSAGISPTLVTLDGAPTVTTVNFKATMPTTNLAVRFGVTGNFSLAGYSPAQTTLADLLATNWFTNGVVTSSTLYLGQALGEQASYGSGVNAGALISALGLGLSLPTVATENQIFKDATTFYSATGNVTGDSIYGYAGSVTYYENHSPGKYSDVVIGGAGGANAVVLPSATSAYSIVSSNSVWDNNAQKSNLPGFYVQQHGAPSSSGALLQVSNVQTLQFADTTLQTKWFSEAQALGQSNPSQFTTLTGMYIAYFNRAPDAVGLDYWASNMYEGATASQIARNFSASPEALATFGSVSANSSTTELTTFVNGVYQNVLNRTPDVGGVIYWVSELKSGTVAPGDFILAIINAVNSQTGTADKTYVTSKTSVGAHFAVTDGLTNTTQAKAVMAAFNSTYASSGATAAIKAANALSDSYLANVATTPELVVQLVGVHI